MKLIYVAAFAVSAVAVTAALGAPDSTERGKPLPTDGSITNARRPSGSDMVRLFPRAALGARRNGKALIECLSTARGVMTDCVVLSEEPADGGFGAATLELSAKFRIGPESVGLAGYRVPIPVTWRLDGAAPAAMVTPTMIGLPTVAIYAASTFYPAAARQGRVEGRAVVDCTVMSDRHLGGCELRGEAPAGQGFGDAAVRVALDRVVDQPPGAPSPVGKNARLGIYWKMAQPQAPRREIDLQMDRDQGVQPAPEPGRQ